MRYALTSFYLLLILRLLLLDFVLEPTNDEGLWQWNARCEHWDLPAHGILHSALSPVNHWINRALFSFIPPSVEGKRLLCSLFVALAAGLSCLRLVRRGNETGALLLLAWLWLDPYLFRMGSWAILEPLLMLGIVAWFGIWQNRLPESGMPSTGRAGCPQPAAVEAHNLLAGNSLLNGNESRDPTYPRAESLGLGVKHALAAGLLTGLLIGVKLTVIWLVLGACAFLLFSRRFRELLVFGTATAAVAALCYLTVYLHADPARFVEMWRQHTTERTQVVANVCALFQGLPDLRSAFYTLTALLGCGWWLWRFLRQRQRPTAAIWAVAAGLAALATQSCRPERYFFPMAFLALLASLEAGMLRQCRRGLAAAFLLLALGANILWYRVFVVAPANQGGWYMHAALKEAQGRGAAIAAPPHLALDLSCPVQPVSNGLLSIPADAAFRPDILVLQNTAAIPSGGDSHLREQMIQRHASVTHRGFYTLYVAPASSAPPPAQP